MKKGLLAVVLACVLCAVSVFAMADSWDLLHSAIRVATPEEIERLATEQGFQLTSWGDEGDYNVDHFFLEGIPCYDANLYNFASEPTYACVLYFHADSESTLDQPGEAFETLSAALISKYGEPAFDEKSSDGLSLSWYFEDASVRFTWSTGTPPDICLSIYGTSIMGDTKFPFEPASMTATPVPTPIPAEGPISVADASETFTFRNGVVGGMTAEEVIAVEGRSPDAQAADSLRYDGEKAAGFSAELTYQFENGKLAVALYQIEMKSDVDASNITNYAAINAALASKYGDAATNETNWSDDLLQDNPSAQGMAVALGHLSYRASWIVQDAVIEHTLSGGDNPVRHALTYTFAIPPEPAPDTTGI